MITVEITQFIERVRHSEVPNDCAVGYEAIHRHKCRLTAEVLMNGMVSQCIEHDEGDFAIEITKNGPEVQDALVKMIREFDGVKFDEWLSCVQGGCEFDEDGVAF